MGKERIVIGSVVLFLKTGSMSEYEQLRGEMHLRVQLLYDYGSRTITTIVAIFDKV